MNESTLELTHRDLAEAFERVLSQLYAINDSVIVKNLNMGMIDIDDVIMTLKRQRNVIIVDAHRQGALEWK